MVGTQEDTITLYLSYLSGLAGVMAVNVAGVPTINIAVVNCFEISFKFFLDHCW